MFNDHVVYILMGLLLRDKIHGNVRKILSFSVLSILGKTVRLRSSSSVSIGKNRQISGTEL